jgi:long-chain acyl-CoA synthetase
VFGGTVYVMEHFDAEGALAAIDRYKVTHSQWVPTMFIRMLKLPKEVREQYDVSSLQVAIHAAAPCPVPVKQQMMEWWGPVIYEYYAGSEGNGYCAISPQEWLKHPGSVGKCLLGILHIVDEATGEEAEKGRPGLVYFEAGPEFEYHDDPEKTKNSRNEKGWTTLGDIGYVDKDGYLYLTDRKAFMIITGGVNVYPQEVENVLVMHPKVMDAAVFGVPNEEFGEEVKAVIQPREWDAALANGGSAAAQALAGELIAYCREHLSHIKCPRTVDFMEQLPRHPTGKLYKKQLRDQYWQKV